MSGPITPPLTVETVDGATEGRPITTIKVTNGDLTISGNTATIDTSGSGGTAAGSDTEIQINDGGAFGASSNLTFASNTLTVENAIDLGATGAGGRLECTQDGQDLQIKHTGSGAVVIKNLTNNNDTNLNIVGPGSGDANIVMSSTSGAGGITFPDGTEQTTAATGGTPGGSDTEIQYNDGGSFAGDAGFIIDTAGAGDTTKVRIGKMMYGGSIGAQNVTLNGSVGLTSEGTGQILLRGAEDAGGTWTDTIVQVLCNAAGDDSILTFKNNSGTAKEAKITLDGSLDFIIDNTYAGGGNIELLPGSGNYVKIGGGAATGTLTSNGAYDLQLSTNSGTNSGLIAITNGVNGSIDITPNGSGLVKVSNLTVAGNYSLPTAVTTTNDYVLTAQTDGSTAWAEAGGGGATELSGLTDVLIDTTEFSDGILIQPNSDGAAPTTGTLSGAQNNVGIGADTFSTLTTGYKNVAIGGKALSSAITSSQLIAIGYEALAAEEGTQYGVAIGSGALKVQNGGTGRNTAVGARAGEKVTLGKYNALYSYKAGFDLTEGIDNICIGTYSGKSLTTGDGSLFIGHYATADSATDDLQLKIGGGHSFGATTVTWISSDSTGSCYQGDNASSWSTTSDERLKTNIVDSPKGLEEIKLLKVRNFNYIEKATPITEEIENEDGEIEERIIGYDGENKYNLDPEPLRTGFIAQELEVILPEAVKENLHGHKTVDIDPVIYSLINAVQELSAKVETLEAMIE